MNNVEVTLTGDVSLDPQSHRATDGGNFLSVRVAVNERRYDRERAADVDTAASFLPCSGRATSTAPRGPQADDPAA